MVDWLLIFSFSLWGFAVGFIVGIALRNHDFRKRGLL